MNQLEMDNSTIMFRAVDDNDIPLGEYQNIQCFNIMYTLQNKVITFKFFCFTYFDLVSLVYLPLHITYY